MILKGISVNQNPPTKDYLWITPKGNTRFWDQSTWRLIGGNGGGGGGDLPTPTAAGKYLKSIESGGNYGMSWGDIDLSSYINGDIGYAAVFSSNNSIVSAKLTNSKIRIGDGIIEWDSTNNGFKIYNATSTQETPTTAGIYADWVSALGPNSSGGGGGGDINWANLTTWDEDPEHIINENYLPYNLEYVTSHPYYAIEADANGKLYVNVNWHDTTYNAGTGLSLNGTTFNHSNSISQGNFGLSNNTTANSVTLPYVSYDGQGHISAVSSNTFTIGNLNASTVFNSSTKIPFVNLPDLYIGYTKISNSTNSNAQLKGISKITHAITDNDTSTAAIEWDQTNNAWHFYGGIYSDSFVSALGAGSGGGGGGGINVIDLWNELTNAAGSDPSYQNTQIAISHIPTLSITDKTSGTLPITRGGTGRTTTASGAWYNTAANQTSPTIGILPIAQGGTGNTTGTAEYSRVLKNYYTYGTRPTSANFTHVSDGGVVHFKATSSMSTNYPGVDGHILHFNWDNSVAWDSQLFIPDNHSSSMRWRAQNSGPTWSTTWKTLIDSGNYNSYSPTLTGTGASGTWGINISGNADTVDNEHASAFAHIGSANDLLHAGNEFTFASSGFSGAIYLNYRTAGGTNGNISSYIFGNGAGGSLGTALHSGNYSSYALPLSGGTMTGNLVLKGGQYNREGALNCNNSDIINVNSILTNDIADSFGEGLCFYRSASTWDCMTASNGMFYFGSNKAYQAALAGDASINCGTIKLNNNSIIYNSQNYAILHSNNTDKYTLLNYDGATNSYRTYIDGNDIYFRYGTGHTEAFHIDTSGNIIPNGWTRNLGSSSGGFHTLWIGGSTSADMGYDTTTNPRIIFGGNSITQKVQIVYSHYDSYRAPRGLKVMSADAEDSLSTWFEVEGTCYVGNLSSSGYVTALVSNSSDKRLKKEIKPFNAKQIIDKLKPVEFEWNKKANKYNSNLELNKKNYGLIAQDSDGIIDNFVFDLPDGKGYKGVRYEKLIPILLQAVKEQQKEIDELKQIIKKLKV